MTAIEAELILSGIPAVRETAQDRRPYIGQGGELTYPGGRFREPVASGPDDLRAQVQRWADRRDTMASCLAHPQASSRLGGLLDDLKRYRRDGRGAEAQEIARTIEDLCGRWRGCRFYDADAILDAFRPTVRS